LLAILAITGRDAAVAQHMQQAQNHSHTIKVEVSSPLRRSNRSMNVASIAIIPSGRGVVWAMRGAKNGMNQRNASAVFLYGAKPRRSPGLARKAIAGRQFGQFVRGRKERRVSIAALIA
jgi:hypothetical protein